MTTLIDPPQVRPHVVRRLHLLAVGVALVVLAFVQTPGRIAPDTKADLSIDPLGFLLRAGHLWEPLGDSGQLQNQAYGYFLPMGPVYVLGHLVGLPAWVVQRIWWAIVLLVAFYGMYRLLDRMAVGNHPIQVIAALTFALSPRMLTELGPVSIEAWPNAMAPWVLLPLIKVRPGYEGGAAARSGLAVAFCGGVNAVAVGAVLPLPIWWLLTRQAGPSKRRLSRWWVVAVSAGMFWWLAPLILLGRYSPPFLDWIESAAVSTSKATLPGAFRGTTQWVAWFQLPEPIWPAGWAVLSSPIAVLLGWLLIALALLGMSRRDTPDRRFLIGGTVAGLVLLTLGHTGTLTAPWAPAVQDFLDGAGAPLRNTHKFDLILRIPLTIALAHGLSRVRLPAAPPTAGRGLARFTGHPRALWFITVCALIGTAAPALVGQLPARGGFAGVPSAWSQAAEWLEQNHDGARTLIVPGSSFATSTWGDPHDEPFQALARTPWATRSGVPLSSAGNIRLLNTIEQQLETGRGSPGLAEYLARAGISRVLLRSDLQRAFQPGSAPLPVTVRSALAASPGLRPVARFGPDLQGARDALVVADDGLDVPQPQIEIWEITTAVRAVDVLPAQNALRLAGGPESLLTLADAGRLGARPVVLDGDPEAIALSAAPLVLTDSIQRREANFAQVRDNYSDPLTADQEFTQERAVHDWLPFAAPAVTARYQGISGVRAASQAGAANGPWHAVDGDPTTAWTSSIYSVGQWFEVDFERPVTLPGTIALSTGPAGARLAEVRVSTDTGAETTAVDQDPGSTQQIAVPGGSTSSLRLTVTRVWPGEELAPVSIGELALPGVEVGRRLVLPPVTSGPAPETIVLQAARDGVDGCVLSERAVCSPRLQRQSEDSDIDRELTLPASARYTLTATARPRPGAETEELLVQPESIRVTASSRRNADPVQRPGAVADRDPGTAWLASSTDARPTLTLSWPKARRIERLRWQVDPTLAASKPSKVDIIADGRTQSAVPDADGWISFDPVRTSRVQIVVTGIAALQTLDRASGFTTVLPVGASEIVIPGADEFRLPFEPADQIRTRCGTGPALVIGDRRVRTQISGNAAEVLWRQPMSVLPCGADSQVLPAGTFRLALLATDRMEPVHVVFNRADIAVPPQPTTTAPLAFVEYGPEHRVVTVEATAEAQVLLVHENANPGWRATLGDRELQSVRIDGWQQAWIVPAWLGGEVELRFTPGDSYRAALWVGLVLVLVLAIAGATELRRWRHRTRRASAGRAATLAAAATLGTDLRPIRVPLARPEPTPVRLREARSGVLDVLLGLLALLSIAGFWGPLALLTVLVLFGLPVALGYAARPGRVLVGACAIAAPAAALSNNADIRGWAATVSVAAALLVVAALVARLDLAGAGLLTRRPGGLILRLIGRQPDRQDQIARIS